MNRLQKALCVPAIVTSFIFLPSCGDSSDTHNHDSMHTENEEGHVHTFACPMHPEVTGHEGENCPKCGMKLEHNDNAGNTNTYFMQFTGIPAAPKAGEEVTLSFIPKIKGKEAEQVPLDVEHEKKIHLIIVSNDLSWYEHIHPEYQADGSYQVKTKFPSAGTYTLFADYIPSGGNHQLEKIALAVSGNSSPNVPLGNQRLSGTADGYELSMTNESGFVTNNLLHFGATIKKDGKTLAPDGLENYLGAKAHVVIVGLDSKAYMHVHPEVVDGKFDLHTTFDQPGMYKGWFQFQTNGQVHTIDFVLDVKEAKAGDVKAPGDHGQSTDAHDHKH